MSFHEIFVVVLLSLTLRASCVTICVSWENRTAQSCMGTLQDAVKKGLDISPSTIVIEIRSSLYLNETVYVENLSGVFELKSTGYDFVISCVQQNSGPTNTGIVFHSVKNIAITDLVFDGCGSLQNSTTKDMNQSNKGSGTVSFKSGLYFLNCSNVSLANVVVRNGDGTGVSFFDTTGIITILHCVFENNRPKSPHPGGGGVYVEFTYCSPGRYNDCDGIHSDPDHTMYLFHNCSFMRNHAFTYYPEKIGYIRACRSEFQGLGQGGGLSIFYRGFTQNKHINVSNCTFNNNSAISGGALYAGFQDHAHTNIISVETTTFVNNSCTHEGGAVVLGYTFLCKNHVIVPQTLPNNITLNDCLFENNNAKHGGGIYLFSTRGTRVARSHIKFCNCTWTGNKALSGSAVDIIPEVWERLGNGNLPVPLFIDCTFTMNKVTTNSSSLGPNVTSTTNGVGAILITRFSVKFKGRTIVSYNSGTALYLISSIVEFSTGSVTSFHNNTGRLGGAVALITFSVMFVNDNATLEFVGNGAKSKGGAIYKMSIEKHDTSRSCFMQYIGENSINQRNVSITFTGNNASTNNGNAIHATSLSPCFCSCARSNHSCNAEMNLQSVFHCVGKVVGQIDDPVCCNVTTEPREFRLDPRKSLTNVFPNERTLIPLTAHDELYHNQTVVYQATMESQTRSISVDPSYQLISNGIIKFQGESGAKGTLLLDHNDISVSFHNVTLGHCPPGFVNKNQTCVCAAKDFLGMKFCDLSRGYVTLGYWVGIYNHSIHTSNCPAGFCSYNCSNCSGDDIKLPYHIADLDLFVCGPTRTGVLCGQCRENHSTNYHSYSYRCADNKLCHIGWLLYLLSELVPLTIVFIIVMLFNISFTSGAVNGFVLFAQIVDSFSVDASGYILHEFPHIVRILTPVHRFLYRMFNFDFFSNEHLSFCLWRGASALDAMVMKYVTIIYAFGLVMLTVVLMSTWKCKVLLSHWRPRSLRNAIIHGLSTLFVMCYSQSARASFQIINVGFLYDAHAKISDTVVFRSGNLTWGQGKHLLYAIPALFFLFFMVLIPPVLLILFPLVFKVLALCNLSETKVAIFISRLIPMQLLDSFQGCFKDKFRFFSGFYFLYRSLALAAFVFSDTFLKFYSFVAIGLTVILGLHAIVQPYKESLHNVIDSLIFSNLAVINGISLYNYIKTTEGTRIKLELSSTVQLILIFLPLIIVISCLTLKLCIPAISKMCSKQLTENTTGLEDSCDLPPLRDDHNDGIVIRHKYKAFN